MTNAIFTAALLTSALLSPLAVATTQVSVQAALEQRFFFEEALYSGQHRQQFSAFIEPEIYHSWNDEQDSITFKPFYRWDAQDQARTHGDIRELMWLHVGDNWELRTGIGRVFWGQTESQHLVDVINQTDVVEAVDGEDKRGQAMINLKLINDFGMLDLFVLPGFRERTFAGEAGRFRPATLIDQQHAAYESGAKEQHIDLAARWSQTLGDIDVGVSYFNGTARDPDFLLTTDNADVNKSATLTPYYAQMAQVGVDVLMVQDAWLLKFEGIYRDVNNSKSYVASTAGFEYTSVGVVDSVWDIGWLMEYQYDSRDEQARSPGQNDLMFGTRLALNDIQGSEVLIGVVQDLDNNASRSAFIEASSRLSDQWKWRVDAWFFSSDNHQDPSYAIRHDDYAQLSLEYYY